jgi:hypothetical protein
LRVDAVLHPGLVETELFCFGGRGTKENYGEAATYDLSHEGACYPELR